MPQMCGYEMPARRQVSQVTAKEWPLPRLFQTAEEMGADKKELHALYSSGRRAFPPARDGEPIARLVRLWSIPGEIQNLPAMQVEERQVLPTPKGKLCGS
jgi:hypothetical protein